uniref:Uncharacterized protein n=1 Tax=Lygus hesperus TaxID=30085 RepID=A0A146L6J3_LYGHE
MYNTSLWMEAKLLEISCKLIERRLMTSDVMTSMIWSWKVGHRLKFLVTRWMAPIHHLQLQATADITITTTIQDEEDEEDEEEDTMLMGFCRRQNVHSVNLRGTLQNVISCFTT